MRNITILISILCFWFFLATGLTLVAGDAALAAATSFDNYSSDFFINTTNINSTAEAGEIGSPSLGGFIDMAVRMFTFRIPSYVMPSIFNIIVNFMNYFLLLIVGIVIYRLASPATGG